MSDGYDYGMSLREVLKVALPGQQVCYDIPDSGGMLYVFTISEFANEEILAWSEAHGLDDNWRIVWPIEGQPISHHFKPQLVAKNISLTKEDFEKILDSISVEVIE